MNNPEIVGGQVQNFRMAADLDLGSELETHLRMYEEGMRGLREFDWSVVTDERLLDGVRRMDQVERQIPAGRSHALSEVKTRGLPEQHGCRTAAAFLRQLLNCSAAEAGSRLALADDLVPGRSLSTGELLPPRLPALAAAVAARVMSAPSRCG